MSTHQRTARVVGGLYIVATVAGVLSLLLTQPVVDAPDYLATASLHQNRVATGALFVLIMAIAVVGIAIAIYPVLRRHSPRLAMGYVVARTIEAVIYLASTVALLTLVTLSQQFMKAGTVDAARFQPLGALLLAGRDWGDQAVQPAAVFGLSAVLLNFVLYRARLVPRWLSVWGLVGATLWVAAGVLVLYGLEPLSTTQTVLAVPIGVQELALAVWLLVKGFNASAFASKPQEEPALSLL
jgi:hypothetical protein